MQHAQTVTQGMISSVRQLQAVVRHGSGVGLLVAVLLLPLPIGALGTGDLDTSFSSDGKVTTNFGGTDTAHALALQPDGKIVVAGTASGNFALARYLANGSLDTSFSGDGKVTTDLREGCEGDTDQSVSALALQPDGKIVAAGASRCSGRGFDFALVRYLPNGDLDAPFSDDGLVLTHIGLEAGISALILQPDGKIVAAGFSDADSVSNSFDFALVRYTATGALDTSFSGDGIVITDFGGNFDAATALAIQPNDGRLVVAGTAVANFALARYHAITCSGVVVTRINTASNGTSNGTTGNDVIYDFGGNNSLYGLEGNDILCGGPGADVLSGGSGDDMLRGGPGKDTCDGGTHVSKDQAFDCETVKNVP